MRSTYIVKRGQNIYDVAIQLYGSLEGLFDLMISNEDLDADGTLAEGQELVYHTEYIQNSAIVNELNKNGTVVANGAGEDKFVQINPATVLAVLVVKPIENIDPQIKIVGTGVADVLWGNSDYNRNITLSSTPTSSAPCYIDDEYTIYIANKSHCDIQSIDVRYVDMKMNFTIGNASTIRYIQ